MSAEIIPANLCLDHASEGSPRTGRGAIAHWDFYMIYNMFRLAAILQGIMGRVVEGNASSANAREQGARAHSLAEAGWRLVQASGG